MISRLADPVKTDPHARLAHVNARKLQARVRLALFLSDVAFINVAFALGYLLRYQLEWFRHIEFSATFADYGPIQVLFNLALLAFFWLDGVYAIRRAPSWLDQIWTITGSVIKAVFIVWVAIFIYGPAV